MVEKVDGIGYIITEACFYFYLGSIYGVVEIEYSDFGVAEVKEEEATRSWLSAVLIAAARIAESRMPAQKTFATFSAT